MNRTSGRVGASSFLLFTLSWLALWTVQLTPLPLLIPLQLNTPDDANGWISGVVSSASCSPTGGIAGVIAAPLAGGLSDRTRGRFGRRRPWALAGVALGTASLVGIAFAQGPWGVGLAWVGVSVGVAIASAAFTALIADQLTTQRGSASAAVASSQALGIVVGVGVIVLLELGVLVGYLVLAVILAVLGTLGALLLPDPPPPPKPPSPRGPYARRAARGLRDRDFAWLLAGRLTVNIGNALGTGLLLFFLLYGLHRDAAAAEDELLLLILVYTLFVVTASIVSGRISDRTGRRIPFVVWSAVLQGLASFILVLAPSLVSAMIAAALLGLGYGAYMSVGLALGTDLPAVPRGPRPRPRVRQHVGQPRAARRAAPRCGPRRDRRGLLAAVPRGRHPVDRGRFHDPRDRQADAGTVSRLSVRASRSRRRAWR